MRGMEASSTLLLLLSSFLQISLCGIITQLNPETIREENIMDVVVEHKRYNVTVVLHSDTEPVFRENVHVEHCKGLREELEDKINELHDQSRVNSVLAIRIAELQSALRQRNQDSTFQVSVLQQKLQEAIKKLDTKMANIHNKGVTTIEVHNFAVFLQQWVINQTTGQITLLQNEQEQMISKLDEEADNANKLILQILALKTRLAQIQSETSPEKTDLLQELKTKFEQLKTKCSELELNHTLYLQIVDLQSRIWDFETKTPDEVISRMLSDTLNQLEDKMHQLNGDRDDDTNLVLKIYFLQSIVRELQRQSVNPSKPGEDAGLEKKLTDKKKELEEALMQLKRRDGRNSEMLVKIVGLQKMLSDLHLESQNSNATAHIAGLQKQLNVMSERNLQLQTKYNELLRELQQKGDLLTKSYSKNAELVSRVTELETQLESASHEKSAQITMLQNKLEDSIANLNEKANDNSKLILQILTLQTEVREMQQGSSSQIADLQFQLQEKTRKLRQTSEKLEINMDLNSKLVLQILELQGIIWDLERGVSNTTGPSQIADLLRLLESKISQLENTTTDESKTVLKIFTLQSVIRELRREASNVTVPDQVIEVQMRLEQKTKDLEGALVQLNAKKDENSQLLAKIVQLQDKVSEVKASNQTASILISGMRKKLRDVDEKYARLQKSYSDLQKQFRTKEEAYEQLKTTHAELLKKLNGGTEINSKLQRQLDDKDEEYSILKIKYDELRKQLKEKNENCSRLQSEYNELKDHLDARKVEELRLQENYFDLKKQLTEKETEYSRLKSKYEDLQNQLSEKTSDFNKLQNTVSDMRKELNEENDFKIKTDDFSMDPSTAHPKIILSSNNRVVVVGSVRQKIPDSAQRFDVIMAVLGKQGFASGRHYWEIHVGQRSCYGVGVALGSAQRQGSVSLNPNNGYWGIIKNRRDQVFAMATPRVPLNLRTLPHSVGVLLDYKKGQLSFYNSDTRSHIYTFTGNAFNGKLFPFILSCEDGAEDDGPIILSPAPEDVSWLE
ncbi:putative leucine-rich repeat-containing protein DDB_G0290503 [Brienomyrus brachyistius]|uniref:putative leucine-rich repeat-containing protein DDB_G0290503 n=1 Tax=Brienomyrus brachyistius TaxID=42636 RepID=UPI0020B1EDB8|nr:putative leucine-rich repeat-containing protein DDB_G0290503 [Brienomyrus brachyistius]